MRYGRYGWSHIWLRLGLGIVFLWIGVDAFRHPFDWIGFVPTQLPFGWSRELGLKMVATVDVGLGLGFILRLWQRLVALVAVIHLAVILVLQPISAVIIRDVGLLGASLALLFWPQHGYRRKWRLFKKRDEAAEET